MKAGRNYQIQGTEKKEEGEQGRPSYFGWLGLAPDSGGFPGEGAKSGERSMEKRRGDHREA